MIKITALVLLIFTISGINGPTQANSTDINGVEVLIQQATLAQATPQPEMADGFRQEGKIYVVVAVVLVILLGVLAYAAILDRKLKKLERKIDEHEN